MASITKAPQKSWTNVTSDAELVKHLLELYFCWEYPTLASLSKEHFRQDFSSGSSRYCSPLLVNALLALGSRFSDRPEPRTDPDDPFTAGDAFFEEAKRLFWEQTDHQDLTAVQAIGIMSIREASCGRDIDSRYYAGQSVRLAIEMGLHRLDDDGTGDDHRTVQLITLWGAFSLDHAWSLTTGGLPQFSRFPRFPSKIHVNSELEETSWAPYTDDGPDPRPEAQQPCHIRSVFNCFCELKIYHKYLHWYENIPDALRLGLNF
ncbi:transcription factor domain-containing protein, partial [Schizothecium vesticola]